jgi:hypothetical protein
MALKTPPTIKKKGFPSAKKGKVKGSKGKLMPFKHGAHKKTPVGKPKKTMTHKSPSKVKPKQGDVGFQAYRRKYYNLKVDNGTA